MPKKITVTKRIDINRQYCDNCSRIVNTKKHNIVKTTAEDFTAGTKHTRRHSILEKKTTA